MKLSELSISDLETINRICIETIAHNKKELRKWKLRRFLFLKCNKCDSEIFEHNIDIHTIAKIKVSVEINDRLELIDELNNTK